MVGRSRQRHERTLPSGAVRRVVHPAPMRSVTPGRVTTAVPVRGRYQISRIGGTSCIARRSRSFPGATYASRGGTTATWPHIDDALERRGEARAGRESHGHAHIGMVGLRPGVGSARPTGGGVTRRRHPLRRCSKVVEVREVGGLEAGPVERGDQFMTFGAASPAWRWPQAHSDSRHAVLQQLRQKVREPHSGVRAVPSAEGASRGHSTHTSPTVSTLLSSRWTKT